MNECLHIVIKEDKAASLHVFSISCFQHMFKNNKTADSQDSINKMGQGVTLNIRRC